MSSLNPDNTLSREASADGDYDSDSPHLWLTMSAVGEGKALRSDIGLRLGFAKWRERTWEPVQRMENEAFRVKVQWGGSLRWRTVSLRPEVAVAADIALDKKLKTVQVQADRHFQPVGSMVDYFRNNRAGADLSVRIGVEVSDGLCFALTPQGSLTTHTDGEHVAEFNIGLSAIF